VSDFKCDRCKADPRPEHFGSDRECAFNKDGTFTPKNWNCATLGALMDMADMFEHFGTDESMQVIAGEAYNGFLVLNRYKRRGCTSSALHVGDFWPAKPLTLKTAESWLDGTFQFDEDDDS
jgi:hypothetical protein